MAQRVRTRRKNRFNFLKEAETLESFDEFPMLRPEVDPQLHISRNTVDQPFFLRCRKDSVIAQPVGASRVEFTDGPIRYFDTEPGDFVYVPAGYAHRVLTLREGVLLRYKAREFGGETVLWYCAACGEELHHHEIDDGAPVQAGYAEACETFNSDPVLRKCRNCGAEHPVVNLAPFRWRAITEALTREESAESA
jgi:hypothetical protein